MNHEEAILAIQIGEKVGNIFKSVGEEGLYDLMRLSVLICFAMGHYFQSGLNIL